MSTMLAEHLGYVSDARRLALYRQALHAVVCPGDAVVDLGCGSGVLGWMGLQAGAGSVVGVDESDALELARRSMAQTLWKERCRFERLSSFRFQPQALADVVVCDHVGYFGLDYGIIEMLADARLRMLKPGGHLMPRRLVLHLAAVDGQQARGCARQWMGEDVPEVFHWVNGLATNQKHAVDLKPADVLSIDAVLANLDLVADQPDFMSWSVVLQVERPGRVQGLAGWFEAELAPGVWMTNSPLDDQRIRRQQAFFPFADPLPVAQGDQLLAHFMVRHRDGHMAWSVEHAASGLARRADTWASQLAPAQGWQQLRDADRPLLSDWGQARRCVLNACDGQSDVATLVLLLQTQFPRLLPTPGQYRQFVLDVLRGAVQP